MYDSLMLSAREECSLIEDYMGEERTGRYIPKISRVFTVREMQQTHPEKRSSMYNKAYKGDVFELFDEIYGGEPIQ